MTTTIGSQANVPDPGSPITSPWAQDTARKIVHTFPNVATRDAWASPPDGAMCVTTDTDTLWQRKNAVWAQIAASSDLAALTADTGWLDGTPTAGFSGTIRYRRFGAMVQANWYCTRTAGNITAQSTGVWSMPNVPSRPSETIRGVSRITAPADALAFEMLSTGILTFTSLTINTNGIVIGGAAWIVTPSATLL
jgi:hypothetical protein